MPDRLEMREEFPLGASHIDARSVHPWLTREVSRGQCYPT